jgi:hypothetical protein
LPQLGSGVCVEITAHGHDGVAVRGGGGGLQQLGPWRPPCPRSGMACPEGARQPLRDP